MTAANVSQLPEPKRQRPRKKAAPVVQAQEAEANDGFIEMTHRKIKLRVPIEGKLPIAAVDAFRAGDNYEGTKQMLGPEQWKKLSDAGMTLEELDEVGNQLEKLQGN